LALSSDDRVRADVIQSLMCRGAIEFREIERRHGIDFESYFAEALERVAPLVRDGIVSLSGRQLRATDRGRFVLRMVAMCFDLYLAPAEAHPGGSSGAPPPNATDGARDPRFSSVL
jgi:oxygen-independent coproporphyrinogen-3 oxidase